MSKAHSHHTHTHTIQSTVHSGRTIPQIKNCRQVETTRVKNLQTDKPSPDQHSQSLCVCAQCGLVAHTINMLHWSHTYTHTYIHTRTLLPFSLNARTCTCLQHRIHIKDPHRF
eukprot:GDKI01040769.1.p1 GENE.GDKI01040769.1~~GDKI01040769.1.p1  ORF type:complete len:113 (+),score=25.96 GDKI01040769.1:341-679(+)